MLSWFCRQRPGFRPGGRVTFLSATRKSPKKRVCRRLSGGTRCAPVALRSHSRRKSEGLPGSARRLRAHGRRCASSLVHAASRCCFSAQTCRSSAARQVCHRWPDLPWLPERSAAARSEFHGRYHQAHLGFLSGRHQKGTRPPGRTPGLGPATRQAVCQATVSSPNAYASFRPLAFDAPTLTALLLAASSPPALPAPGSPGAAPRRHPAHTAACSTACGRWAAAAARGRARRRGSAG